MKSTIDQNYPLLVTEWNYEQNGGLKPSNFTAGSNHIISWKCSQCGNIWEAPVYKRTNGSGCPECAKNKRSEKLSRRGLIPGQNDLKTLFPEVANDWDYEMNPDRPENYLPKSMKEKYWKCPEGHSYVMKIASRTTAGNGCSYCAGKKILVGFNDLASQYPDIAKQWNTEKNDKKPSEVFAHGHYNAYWNCDNAINNYNSQKNL